MFKRLFSRFATGTARPRFRTVTDNDSAGACPDLFAGAREHEGIAHPDWSRVFAWLETLPEDDQPAAWMACERAWLLGLSRSLGGGYRVFESANALLLASLDERMAQVTVNYLETTFSRIGRLLGDFVPGPGMGKEVLLILDDQETYYRYVDAFQDPEDSPMSAGMCINIDCVHFVTCNADLGMMEPTIVHEMTHSFLSGLPIPAWLNEGMAVNMERVFAGSGDVTHDRELVARHRDYWTGDNIQSFWSGRAYLQRDQGSELAYDLGRSLVAALSSDWPRFMGFVAQASWDDAGDAAAQQHLDTDIGESVRAFVGGDEGDWAPDPARWEGEPEAGRFRRTVGGRVAGHDKCGIAQRAVPG